MQSRKLKPLRSLTLPRLKSAGANQSSPRRLHKPISQLLTISKPFFGLAYMLSKMDHTRKCQVCAMRAQNYRFDFHDPGSGSHLGHYRCRYTSPSGVKFSLYHTSICAQCRYDGLLISRLTFSAQPLEIDVSKKESNSSQC